MEKENNILPIHIDGDPILRTKCEEITKDYPNLKEIIEQMHNTLDSTGTGVGLAAPQVGLPIRVFILGGKNMERKTFINPVLKFSGELKSGQEGCLSVPKLYADVERYKRVKVVYYDENFIKQKQSFKKFEAVVIQHEYDHLDGIEFYDKISEKDKERLAPEIKKLNNGILPPLEYKTELYEKN